MVAPVNLCKLNESEIGGFFLLCKLNDVDFASSDKRYVNYNEDKCKEINGF